MNGKTALIAGSTGLVGKELVKLALADSRYEQVHTIARRSCGISDQRLTEHIINWDQLAADEIPAVDHVYCALGTTMKVAGSKEAFEKVDYHYVVKLAEISKEIDASRFLVVSSIMADPKASAFYLKTKGKMEQKIQQVGPADILIFRPSTLVGNRVEYRPGEIVGLRVMEIMKPILIGPLRRFRNIQAATVARAMICAAHSGSQGYVVYQSDEIQKMGE